jgi:hypothetical protein
MKPAADVEDGMNEPTIPAAVATRIARLVRFAPEVLSIVFIWAVVRSS